MAEDIVKLFHRPGIVIILVLTPSSDIQFYVELEPLHGRNSHGMGKFSIFD